MFLYKSTVSFRNWWNFAHLSFKIRETSLYEILKNLPLSQTQIIFLKFLTELDEHLHAWTSKQKEGHCLHDTSENSPIPFSTPYNTFLKFFTKRDESLHTWTSKQADGHCLHDFSKNHPNLPCSSLKR